MRVLHLCDDLHVGGLQRIVRELAKWQSCNGHVVVVAAPEAGPLSVGLDVRILAAGSARVEVLAMRRLLREFRPDVVHAHQRRRATVATIARFGLQVPVIEHVHNVVTGQRLVSYRADQLVAVSAGVAQHLTEYFHRRPRNIHVVKNGIRDPGYSPPRTSAGLRIASVGRLVEEKDPVFWVRMVAELRDCAAVALSADWFGDGPLLNDVRALVAELGLGDVVHLHGMVANPAALLPQLDVVTFTSLAEGLPLAGLEALGVGRPIVARDVGGMAELVGDSAGEVLPVDSSPSEFARKVLQVASVDRVSASALSRAHFMAEFSFEEMQQEIVAIYAMSAGGSGE